MAGGTIARDDYRLLMADGIQALFDENVEGIPDAQWSRIFKRETSDKLYEVRLGMVGMGLPTLKSELQSPRVDQPKQGRPVKYVHTTYAMETRLSVEAKNDDRYGKLSRMIVPEMTRNFSLLQEYQHADIFNLGFTTQGYEPDGVSLFNTAHPLVNGVIGGVTTVSNRSSTDAALSITSLAAARTTLRKTRTESGKLTPLTAKYLVVGPSQLSLAEEIVRSTLKPGQFTGGTQPNDQNVFGPAGNYHLEIICWDYLDESLNPNAWFLLADTPSLKFMHFDREKLTSDTDIDKRIRAIIFLAFARYSFGFDDWRGAYASKGA
jgi:hypothetical protein